METRETPELAAYESALSPDGTPHWRRMEAAPCLASYGQDTFLDLSLGGECAAAYVNGNAVAGGMAIVEPGDFVLLRLAGRTVSYRFAGRDCLELPPGDWVCAFTRSPVAGPAVRCACSTVLGRDVAERLGRCPACGGPLKAGGPPFPGEENLL